MSTMRPEGPCTDESRAITKRLSVAQFSRMQDAGMFDGRHVQLLDGELS